MNRWQMSEKMAAEMALGRETRDLGGTVTMFPTSRLIMMILLLGLFIASKMSLETGKLILLVETVWPPVQWLWAIWPPFSTRTGQTRPRSWDTWQTRCTRETQGSSRSSVSADSSLTVILDSPAMVFQPGGKRTRSVESHVRSRESSAAAAGQHVSSHWSWENSVLN